MLGNGGNMLTKVLKRIIRRKTVQSESLLFQKKIWLTMNSCWRVYLIFIVIKKNQAF